MEKSAIGIDLGGTRIKAVAITGNGLVGDAWYAPTRDGGDDRIWKTTVREAVRELAGKNGFTQYVVGISAPGLPAANNKNIRCMPGRLQGLEGFVWQDFLECPAWVLNDAIAALVAEKKAGSARPFQHTLMLTLGTGVGGALLINGKPYQGGFQKAGHLGHMVIDADGSPDVTGMPGSLENAMGNASIPERSHGKFRDTHELLAAYRQGDDFAREVWLTSVRKLALGIASLTNILSPECVILGGGITEAGDDLFVPLREYMNRYEWKTGDPPTPICKACFGDLAGAAGAGWFALQQHENANL